MVCWHSAEIVLKQKVYFLANTMIASCDLVSIALSFANAIFVVFGSAFVRHKIVRS